MAMRLSGLMSGMDTESVIQELVAVRQTKVDDTKKAQTKHEWKQDAWKELNTKIKNLQTKHFNNMRFTTAYMKKTTKVSDSSVASVITGENAVNSVQELEVQQMAKTAYLTGAEVHKKDGSNATALTKLSDLGNIADNAKITLKKGNKTLEMNVSENTTISDVLTWLKNNGLNASFDEKNQRMFVSAKESGKDSDFTLSGSGAALTALGCSVKNNGAVKIDGQDAKILLNDAEFTSKTNVFEINGLTITAMKENKGEKVTLSTESDTDGIYDMIKSFLKDYNELINEIDKLYNAKSAKGYEPLTSEEKEAMTETEVEEWEAKIKDSLLRRDGNLSSVRNMFINGMSSGIEVNGKTMYLADFGIETLGYFSSGDYEKNMYHINGDPDDTATSGNADKLKSMIATDPDAVVSFFSQLSKNMYTEMTNASKSVDGYRSFGSFYDDKKMESDYKDYTSRITDLEEKLTAYEDSWYSKFAAMETALAKMQSNANAVTGMLGGM